MAKSQSQPKSKTGLRTRAGARAEAMLRKTYVQDECKDGFHDACPGGPPRVGQIGILCYCACHPVPVAE